MSEKDLQDQQCEYQPQALPELASMISCLHDHFLDDQVLPTPDLYFLFFETVCFAFCSRPALPHTSLWVWTNHLYLCTDSLSFLQLALKNNWPKISRLWRQTGQYFIDTRLELT